MLIIFIPISIFFFLSALVSLILYIVNNPEKIDKWIYLINKFSLWKNEKSERKVISSNLDYKISSIAKQVNKEADGIIPFGLRIKWANVNDDAYVNENKVIIVLKKEDNNDKNIVNACSAFVPMALLPRSRNSIDLKVLKTLDNYFIKKCSIKEFMIRHTITLLETYLLLSLMNPTKIKI